ncbi:carbohydrate ABC transporter permease [Anaerocolumna sp. AGMB13020]|uniref:carbohydrate ABC transporter permease n=1 Tax=Anaerocolumna sp. AGMB13020 TaxID=3081750 RepID=UPI0029534BBE|nr:carbohydrate ABC transporter permease [Anaerocolumna sp. AGMB13020]WOO37115.1 carbohydrate ABC transporter permease [Anaerocolumna sp. AGMB13020]
MNQNNSYYKKRNIKNILNINLLIYIIFILITLVTVVPLLKIFVDSIDATANYGINLWPNKPVISGYKIIVSTVALYKPFLVSVYVTLVGTLLGLAVSTIAGYVLMQYEMPGRTFLSYLLLFTMIFHGGMVPTYLAMRDYHLINSLWAIILPASLNVYNTVLMRNFFEGIPNSLFDAASIDGCSPVRIFLSVILPLSKAALASIGLMFAVSYWNEYTNFTIYISDANLRNFQVMLRNLIIEDTSLAAASSAGVYQNTVKSAAIMVAIIPFMILYPFLQKYFVKGINMGAVKE